MSSYLPSECSNECVNMCCSCWDGVICCVTGVSLLSWYPGTCFHCSCVVDMCRLLGSQLIIGITLQQSHMICHYFSIMTVLCAHNFCSPLFKHWSLSVIEKSDQISVPKLQKSIMIVIDLSTNSRSRSWSQLTCSQTPKVDHCYNHKINCPVFDAHLMYVSTCVSLFTP